MTKCRRTRVVVGGLYTSKGQDGLWRIVKVLACDQEIVYLRQYTNRYTARPESVDFTTLSLAMTLEDLQKGRVTLGIGCIPVDRRGFELEENFHIGGSPVTQDELADLTDC